MAIVRLGGGADGERGLARAAKSAVKKGAKGVGPGAKKSAKHPAKKHAAKKHAAKKHVGAQARGEVDLRRPEDGAHGQTEPSELTRAFHHLHRAAAVISLLEPDKGGGLRMLLEHGMDLYRTASGAGRRKGAASCAFGLLRAAEHLGMAGLYVARSEYRVKVAPPVQSEVARHLRELGPRLDGLGHPERENARRLCEMARELLRQAATAGHDPHLEYELTMAAEGICTALEEGL